MKRSEVYKSIRKHPAAAALLAALVFWKSVVGYLDAAFKSVRFLREWTTGLDWVGTAQIWAYWTLCIALAAYITSDIWLPTLRRAAFSLKVKTNLPARFIGDGLPIHVGISARRGLVANGCVAKLQSIRLVTGGKGIETERGDIPSLLPWIDEATSGHSDRADMVGDGTFRTIELGRVSTSSACVFEVKNRSLCPGEYVLRFVVSSVKPRPVSSEFSLRVKLERVDGGAANLAVLPES